MKFSWSWKSKELLKYWPPSLFVRGPNNINLIGFIVANDRLQLWFPFPTLLWFTPQSHLDHPLLFQNCHLCHQNLYHLITRHPPISPTLFIVKVVTRRDTSWRNVPIIIAGIQTRRPTHWSPMEKRWLCPNILVGLWFWYWRRLGSLWPRKGVMLQFPSFLLFIFLLQWNNTRLHCKAAFLLLLLIFFCFHFYFYCTPHVLHVYPISLLFSIMHGLHTMSMPYPHVPPNFPCI